MVVGKPGGEPTYLRFVPLNNVCIVKEPGESLSRANLYASRKWIAVQTATLIPESPTIVLPPSTLTQPTPASNALLLEGTYTTTVTKEDIASHGISGHDICENAGTFTLQLAPTFWTRKQVGLPDCTLEHPSSGGAWRVVGDEIQFTDYQPFGCPATPSFYRWKLDSDTLVFERVSDDCPFNYYILASHPWVKQGTSAPN